MREEFSQNLELESTLVLTLKEKQYISAFFAIRKELLNGRFQYLPLITRWRLYSKIHKIPAQTIRKWFETSGLPSGLRKLVGRTKRPKKSHLVIPEIPVTLDEFNDLLSRHPHLETRQDFDVKKLRVIAYFTLKARMKSGRISSYNDFKDFSQETKVPLRNIMIWAEDKAHPRLILTLVRNEYLRQQMESGISQEAMTHRIDFTTTFNTFKDILDGARLTVKSVVRGLNHILKKSSKQLTTIDFRHYNKSEKQKLLSIARFIQKHREKIESLLRSSDGIDSDLRIGIAKGILHAFVPQAFESLQFRLLLDEQFEIYPPEKKRLIQDASNHLSGLGQNHLSRVISQLLNLNSKQVYHNLRYSHPRLIGGILAFLLDITDTFESLSHGSVKAIGHNQSIADPIFLSNEGFLELMARLYGTIATDGTMDRNCSITYYESNKDRRHRVLSLLSQLGLVNATMSLSGENTDAINIPAIIGRMLEKLGLLRGDKVLQSVTLPEFIRNGSYRTQIAFLEEIIPEDGWITFRDDDGMSIIVGLDGTRILVEKRKMDAYSFSNLISQAAIDFIIDNGTDTEWVRGKETYVYKVIAPSLIEELSRRGNSVADGLLQKILRNPPRMLQDVQDMLRMLGIESNLRPVRVTYSQRTKRVSMAWRLDVTDPDSIARFSVLVRVNDNRKHARIQRWMRNNPELVDAAIQFLQELGISEL